MADATSVRRAGSRPPLTSLEVLEELDALLELGFDVTDAILALGCDYSSLRRFARRRGRVDLLQVLSEWKRADADRLARALGRAWW